MGTGACLLWAPVFLTWAQLAHGPSPASAIGPDQDGRLAAQRACGAPGCGRDQSRVTDQNRMREVRPVPPTALMLWGGSGLVTAESSFRKAQDSNLWTCLLEATCLKFTVYFFRKGED